jgi:esterase/lipase
MDDVRAVMQAVGSERAVVFGMSEGGNMAMLFAATYPERTVALITFGVFAKRVYDPSYPWAPTPAQRQQFYDAIEREWGGPMGLDDLAPSKVHDERFRQWWATYQRRSAPPGAALALARMNTQIDVRHVLPAIKVPTLVMHRSKDRDSHVEEGRYIATQIPGARFVELPGEDHLLFVGDQDQVLNEVEKFVETVGPGSNVDCVLATVLCVLTTVQNENEISRFYALARREIGWFKGRLNNSNDHEIKATFDGPIRAIKCAKAIRDAANAIGIETKAGLHTGLCEMTADQASGITVEISRRVAVHAAPGEVLLTNNIMELVSGSGLDFTTKDDRQVEGLFDDGPLFAIN